MPLPHFTRELRLARLCAEGAGRLIRRHLGRYGRIRYKGRINLVTQVDHKAERYVITRLRRAFPRDTILSEEAGKVAAAISSSRGRSPSQKRLWILDPLDGTTNFAHGLPMFCVSIGLQVGDRIAVGVIHHPILNETFIAVRGRGAFLNGKRIHITREKRLQNSLLATGFSYRVDRKLKSDLRHFERFLKRSRAIRRVGSAAIDLAYVACGRFEGFWERDLKPWDVAAGMLILEEAGGKITDFKGGPFQINGRELLATNGHIHMAMRRVLKLEEAS